MVGQVGPGDHVDTGAIARILVNNEEIRLRNGAYAAGSASPLVAWRTCIEVPGRGHCPREGVLDDQGRFCTAKELWEQLTRKAKIYPACL